MYQLPLTGAVRHGALADKPLKFSVFALAVTWDPVTNGAEKYRAIVPVEVAWAAGLTEPIANMADTSATAVIFLLEDFM